MQQVFSAIGTGLVLAILAASLEAFITGLPLAGLQARPEPPQHFAKLALPIIAFGLPAGCLALLLADHYRWRKRLTWLIVGLLLGLVGYLVISGQASAPAWARSTTIALLTALLMGLAASSGHEARSQSVNATCRRRPETDLGYWPRN